MRSPSSPHDICEQILQEIRASQINYVISETPYSAQICLRKRFLKNHSPQNTGQELILNLAQQRSHADLRKDLDEARLKLEMFRVQSDLDRDIIEKLKVETELGKDTIAILESKVEKAEGELYDHFEQTKAWMSNKMEEIKVMKGALKSKDDEMNRNKSVISEHSKLVKTHEKEIYRLEKQMKIRLTL